MSEAVRDQNRVAGLIAETNDSNRTPTPLIVDPSTHRLMVTSNITNFGGMIAGIAFDEIDLGYTGVDMTSVTYKLSSSTVAVLTLTYSSHVLQTITRTV
jgi:hypothetical protein